MGTSDPTYRSYSIKYSNILGFLPLTTIKSRISSDRV